MCNFVLNYYPSMTIEEHDTPISLWQIFWEFTKIGAFTIGGGYMMVPAIQDAISKKKWIDDDELTDLVALSQSAPGLLTVNMSIFTGYRLRGIKGSIIATLGSILIPFLIILLIAMTFSDFQDNPIVVKVFNGVRPAAVAIIAAYMVKLSRKNGTNLLSWGITIATLFLVAFLKISPVYILLILIFAAIAVAYGREHGS